MNTQPQIKNLTQGFIALVIAITLTFGVCLRAQSQAEPPKNAKGQLAPKNDGDTAKITAITVSGATQTNMRQNFPNVGIQNWGCVKKVGSYVEVKVTTQPDTQEAWDKLQWNTGEQVPDGNGGFKTNNYRRYSRAAPSQINVQPTLGGSSLPQLQIWVIWGTYTIGLNGQTDAGQICEEQSDRTILKVDGTWRADIGGSNDLGPTDHCQNASLTYSYSVGRTQGVVALLPPGIGQVVRAPAITPTGFVLWNVRRLAQQRAYINGVANPFVNVDDQGPEFAIDITPSVQIRDDGQPDQGADKLYDADTPAGTPPGLNVNHTVEAYDNFEAWAEVTLDATYEIADRIRYNYQAWTDADNGTGGCYKVELNALAMGNVPLPTTPHYPTRP